MIAKRLRKQVEQLSHEYQIPNLVLDEIDKQILTILHEEGRISYTDLGKESICHGSPFRPVSTN